MATFRSTHCVLLFVLIVLLFNRCGETTEPVATGEAGAVPTSVTGYSQGTLSGRQQSLYVQFATPPDEEIAGGLRLEPAVAGETVVNGNSIVFTPAEAWTPGVTYRASVVLPNGETFVWTFGTAARELEVVSDGLFVAADGRAEVTGTVVTSTDATAADVDRLLSATQGDEELAVTVTADGQRRFLYRVAAATTAAGAPPVVVAYDGTSAGFSTPPGQLTVPLTTGGEFRVESVGVGEEDNVIVVRFTNAVAEGQDLTGLFQLPNDVGYTSRTEGNLVYVYPRANDLGQITLRVAEGISSITGQTIATESTWQLSMGRTEPQLRQVGSGTILPHDGQRLYPFEAIGLSAVRLEVIKIFSGNVGQYLQENSLSNSPEDWSLRHVGALVVQERVDLSRLGTGARSNNWTRYAINLDDFMETDAAALYQIRIGFGPEDAAAACGDMLADFGLTSLDASAPDEAVVGFRTPRSILDSYQGIHGGYRGFSWRDRDDPCKPAYYNRDRFLKDVLLSSNLGLIAKRNPDRSTLVFTTDLLAAGPAGGVTVTAFGKQRQELYRGRSDGNGRVLMTTEAEPALIVAEHPDGDVAYLDLAGDTRLDLSRFAISGTQAAGGIKGAFYAERGVWRPGDEVYLNFILQDRQRRLPDNYPVTFELTDPQGRVAERRTVLPAFGAGFYDLNFSTQPEDLTGNWTATVKAGGKVYRKRLMIEAVKPNRLSIDLETPAGGLRPGDAEATLVAKWLYGAPAADLKATVTAAFSPRAFTVDGKPDFVFHDPARKLSDADPSVVFDGQLNADGRASFRIPTGGARFPGPLTVGLTTKVFERGGNFSVDNQRLPYAPYAVYAGVRVPRGRWGGPQIERNANTAIPLVAVDATGAARANRTLSVGIYRVDWRYWWQDNNDNVARFNSSEHTLAIEQYTVRTDAAGEASVGVTIDDWGRYLIRVCDEGGHCAGEYFYAGYGAQPDGDRESASVLRPRVDNAEVAIGDEVTVSLPSSAGGQLLVSLETSAGSIEQFWVAADAGETDFTFTTDERMVPNVYANVTLLQPYDQTTNDRPVRLYGVVPVAVTDPTTRLSPVITTADEWRPNESVSVAVSEAAGRPMTYTLAVVDEGLLGLTRFRTPDLHALLFSKEALSVTTYDLYRYVIGSYNGQFGKLLAVGGDGEGEAPEGQRANRFEPVVRHLGPFRLTAGQTARHDVQLPNYVGAVRVMVVGSSAAAYGEADKRITVTQPLMVLPTLPRVLGPGERVDMPVNVFATKDKVRDVAVTVREAAGLAQAGGGARRVAFNAPGNQTTYFPVTVGEQTGVARFSVTGKGNGETASQEIEIDVRQPNEEVSRTRTVVIPAGESRSVTYAPFGVVGSRRATVEITGLPALNLQRHLRYLLRYPYGCAEQTTSPAFAQLYLDRLTELNPTEEARRRDNVNAAISRLRKFQTAGGGMAYWPGRTDVNPWASSYVLHFLVEAGRAGFNVPPDLQQRLVDYQRKVAGGWTSNGGAYYTNDGQRYRDQAYRLYTLALAGNAEVGAMNRLRAKSTAIGTTGRYQLAAAYALLGRRNTAQELISDLNPVVKPYQELGYTFGSEVRDMAMILQAQLANGEAEAAGVQAFRLAERVGAREWLNTQEAAFVFTALGAFSQQADQDIRVDFTAPGGTTTAVASNTGVVTLDLPTDGKPDFTVRNTGGANLYATVITSGVPAAGDERAEQENLRLSVAYEDLDGQPLDVTKLVSGTDFVATYTVTNPGTQGRSYRQMALRSIVPSGWEISNDRLNAGDETTEDGYTYRDIRDDRVYTFFHLPNKQKKTFRMRMTATYPGRFYLPTQTAEAMYSHDIQAGVKGRWVEVLRRD